MMNQYLAIILLRSFRQLSGCHYQPDLLVTADEMTDLVRQCAVEVVDTVGAIPTMSLNTFIREVAGLKGTKYMCREGGCGTCVVSMTAKGTNGKERTFAVNSCLVPTLSCHGKAITTIEGIGNRVVGYHPIQKSLAEYNGTQCGYCSPGQIMNMYSLLTSNPKATMKEIEDSFGSNICRCTGYRSILDAFKTFASDSPISRPGAEGVQDIEDIMADCTMARNHCDKTCSSCPRKDDCDSSDDLTELDYVEVALAPPSIAMTWGGDTRWFTVNTISEIFEVFDMIGPTSYRLVAGNTAQGVFAEPEPMVYIDINSVEELRGYDDYSEFIEVGANLTLTDFINCLKKIANRNYLMFGYFRQIASHLALVAHVPVRNIGTIAGNLSIKYRHREFHSDVFLLLETAGATLVIAEESGMVETVSLTEYLTINMNKKVITKVILPALSSEHYYYRTYKIMPRSQNVQALVNAGFLFKASSSDDFIVEEVPHIVYGAISPHFVHATNTESYLHGKPLLSAKTLKTAFKLLLSELNPEFDPAEATRKYRQQLAVNLFYRFILDVGEDTVGRRLRTGGLNLKRPISSGIQVWDTNKKLWPVGQPLIKLEAYPQCAGEAEFVDDIPKIPGELYGALVITDRASSSLKAVDVSKAMAVSGVVAYISAADIPGVNTFIGVNEFNTVDEELFCSGKVIYAGQPVGMIIASSRQIANSAASLVSIKYGISTKPILTVEDALRSGDKSRIKLMRTIEPTKTGSDVAFEFRGSHRMEGQYHYTMELQVALVVPKDDGGMKVYSSTQWVRHNQAAISRALGLPMSSIEVEVKRCGGAFGSRITKSSIVSTACAVAANKLQRPVRMVLDMETNFKTLGHRFPNLINYEVGVNKTGKIQYLNMDFYENYGCSTNDDVIELALDGFKSCYDWASFRVKYFLVTTDIPSTTWMRAPGTLEGISFVEQVMEHIAQVASINPQDARNANLGDQDRDAILDVTGTLAPEYNKRVADAQVFNQMNRWKKKGLSLIPMKFSVPYFPNFYSLVSVYGDDGTVAVTTGGIEVGQGLNTKVAQVCAYTLGINIKLVKVRQTMDITSPNNFGTANSIATDCATYATIRCCRTILDRMKALKAKMTGATWVQLTKAAVVNGINLNASYMYSLADPIPQRAPIYGVTTLEVEVDVLTGQYQILRADVLEDCGESLNPLLDVGQIEGAFVMGLGYYGSEQLKRDPNTGALLTARTWVLLALIIVYCR